MKRSVKRWFAIVLGLTFLLTCSALIMNFTLAEMQEPSVTPGYEALYATDNPVINIATNCTPSIVTIYNSAQIWNRQTGDVSTVKQTSGSGIVIRDGGYIVTNFHVIAEADVITVQLYDGTDLDAEIIGYDASTDLAVIKVDRTDLIPLTFGDSDTLRVGELAVAIGNPGGWSSTVTAGIISGLERDVDKLQAFSRRIRMIQTDAAINPGNSGGALLNYQGQVIGINTLKYTGGMLSTTYDGLGFAIPSNVIKPIVDQLIEFKKVIRPRMGVSLEPWDGPESPIRGYPPASLRVAVVEVGSPAEKGGILVGDYITEINGERVKFMPDVTTLLDTFKAGDVVTVTVYRIAQGATQGEFVELKVALEMLD